MILLGCLLPSPAFSQEFSYEVNVEGVDNDDEFVNTLKASSNLVQLEEKPLSNPSVLIHRGRSDEERLVNVLKSFGYYSGSIRIEIDGRSIKNVLPSQIAKKESSKVVIIVSAGTLYRFDKIQLTGTDQPGLEKLSPAIKPGEPAQGQSVLDAESELIARTKRAGYPYGKMGKRRLILNRKTHTMDVFLTLIPGPAVLLGDLSIEGLEEVKEDFIYNRMQWQMGDKYDPAILEGFRSDLSGLNLFSSIKVGIPEQTETGENHESHTLPVKLKVEERKFRFFGFGGDYSTTEGIGLNAFWGHRNFFGRGEKLKVTGRLARIGENEISNIDQKIGLDFQKPDFLSRKQNLLFNAELVNENPDAFERQAISGSLGISRPLTRTLSFTAGVTGEYSSIEDTDGTEEFTLFGFPVSLKHDTTKDLLDPKNGFRNEFNVTPYYTAVGPGENFTRLKLGSRGYYKVTEDGSVVLAGRVLLGSIVGSSTEDIPADKRYFSGGGGSVRGYAFQNVGPLDSSDDPVGGRSVIEVGAEIRIRYKDFGLVPFIDGGNVYDNEVPKFDEELQWGAGLGVRYYTAFGPLRLDLAVPLNRRDNDDPLAFYISIGQAF